MTQKLRHLPVITMVKWLLVLCLAHAHSAIEWQIRWARQETIPWNVVMSSAWCSSLGLAHNRILGWDPGGSWLCSGISAPWGCASSHSGFVPNAERRKKKTQAGISLKSQRSYFNFAEMFYFGFSVVFQLHLFDRYHSAYNLKIRAT